MKKLNILLDVDGVLADFVAGFTKLVVDIQGGKGILYGTAWSIPDNWNFARHYSQVAIDEAWHQVKTDPDWWRGLPTIATPYEFNRIEQLRRQHLLICIIKD